MLIVSEIQLHAFIWLKTTIFGYIYVEAYLLNLKEINMSKKLCKLVSDDILDKDFKSYTKLVNEARFVCKKCGRVAKDEDSLCKPKAIKVKQSKKSKKD